MVWRQKAQRNVTTKKMRLIDDYQYESEEEKEQQTRKKPDKEEQPKKLTKNDLSEFIKWINEKRNEYKPWIVSETFYISKVWWYVKNFIQHIW